MDILAVDPSTLTCGFGTPWLNHMQPPVGTGLGCQPCEDETVRGCAAFDAAVFWGKYDPQGYTPKERARQRRKAAGHVR